MDIKHVFVRTQLCVPEYACLFAATGLFVFSVLMSYL